MFIPFSIPSYSNGFRLENSDFRPYGGYRSYTNYISQPNWTDSRSYGYNNYRSNWSDWNLYRYTSQPGGSDFRNELIDNRSYGQPGYGDFRSSYGQPGYGDFRSSYGQPGYGDFRSSYSYQPGYGDFRFGYTPFRNEIADSRSYGWPGYEQGGWGSEGGFEGYRTPAYGDFRPYGYYGNYQSMGRDLQEWGGYGPLANFAETPDTNLMVVELPGIDSKDLNLQVAGNTITLTAVRHPYWQNSGGAIYYHTTEGRFGTMRRTFHLPVGISPAQIQASFANGILTIMLPKPSMASGGGNHQGIPVSTVMINS